MNQRQPMEGHRTPPSLPLSGFATALRENISSLKIKSTEQTIKHAINLSTLKCPVSTCSLPCGNSTLLESHILETHGTPEEQEIRKTYDCVPNRIHDMVKRALKEQISGKVLRVTFSDSPLFCLVVPIGCSVVKYFHLQHITIQLKKESLNESTYWHKFETMNHLNQMVPVYVDFQKQIANDKAFVKMKTIKKLYKWQLDGEDIIRREYPLITDTIRQTIAEMLKIPETIEATVAALTAEKKPIYENSEEKLCVRRKYNAVKRVLKKRMKTEKTENTGTTDSQVNVAETAMEVLEGEGTIVQPVAKVATHCSRVGKHTESSKKRKSTKKRTEKTVQEVIKKKIARENTVQQTKSSKKGKGAKKLDDKAIKKVGKKKIAKKDTIQKGAPKKMTLRGKVKKQKENTTPLR